MNQGHFQSGIGCKPPKLVMPYPVSVDTDNPTGDPFGRLRISQPETLFDSKQVYDNAPIFWDDDEVSGSGTSSTYSAPRSATEMGVSATTAGKRVRQTYQYFSYQPGKGQLCLMTGILRKSGGGSGIVRSFGLFNDNNGLFLCDNEGTLQLVRRTYSSGAPVDNRVDQQDWNLDRMDGSGPSGVVLDMSKTNILVIDFEWLGVGRVRMGFNIDGVTYYAHQFLNANVLDVVYMSNPNLPARYEIENDGTGAASTMEHICVTVISEGGQQKIGALRYTSNRRQGVSPINANSTAAIYAVCGFRGKTGYEGARVEVQRISMVEAGNNDFEWMLIFNPVIAGTPVYNTLANSAVDVAVGNGASPSDTTVTFGPRTFIVDGGFVSSSVGSIDIDARLAVRIGLDLTGVPDEIWLCVAPMTSNADVDGSLTWREDF